MSRVQHWSGGIAVALFLAAGLWSFLHGERVVGLLDAAVGMLVLISLQLIALLVAVRPPSISVELRPSNMPDLEAELAKRDLPPTSPLN